MFEEQKPNIKGRGRQNTKWELLLLVINDGARPRELMDMGFNQSVAYRYTSKAKKIAGDYYILRKKLKELRGAK
jgi:hypothetical protein